MGDLPPNSRPQALDSTTTGFARDGKNTLSLPFKSPDGTMPLHSQLSPTSQGQSRQDVRSPSQLSTLYYPQEQQHGPSPLNMAAMAGTLPEYGNSDESQANAQSIPPSLSGASPSAVAYQLGQNIQIPAHAASNLPTHSPYEPRFSTSQYQPNFMPSQGSQHGAYPQFGVNQARLAGPTSMQVPYQNYSQTSQYMYYAAPYGAQGQFIPGFSAQANQQPMYDGRPSVPNASVGLMGQGDFPQMDGPYGTRIAQGNIQAEAGPFNTPYSLTFTQGLPRPTPANTIPRGPPRKPKQSGHALWVGNLPPGTTVIALKDHFSREATKDIESLFLISKSNCAFVNYRTEESCTAAMHRFHDSRFNGVRLVCRLRRTSAATSGVPTGPSAMVGSQQQNISRPETPKQDGVTDSPQADAESPVPGSTEDRRGTADNLNKYFVVKSLTLQDLELSVRNGIWATQSHNEDILNKAFKSAENVYLIFSANKSGEYFGYARMASPILEDGSEFIGAAPRPDNFIDSPDVPKSIPTLPTEWAPKGRIIDDSARGTIFWEATLSGSEGEEESTQKEEVSQVAEDTPITAQSWGKPFKIEWISTNRLPFYRTRGLRNPWNANREVKIARDGTELEPSVGERLIQMFHRSGPSPAGAPMMAGQMLGGPAVPQMRPY